MPRHSSLCRDIVSLCCDIAASMFVIGFVVGSIVACVVTFFINILNFSPFMFVERLLVYVATQFLPSTILYVVTINFYVAT